MNGRPAGNGNVFGGTIRVARSQQHVSKDAPTLDPDDEDEPPDDPTVPDEEEPQGDGLSEAGYEPDEPTGEVDPDDDD